MKNQSAYKLIASDLDGTLLGADQRVSRENSLAISRLAELGVSFVPASGRCIGEMPEDIMKDGSIRYIITSDGAVVWDKAEGRVKLSRYIPRELVGLILDTVSDYVTFPMVHETGESRYDLSLYREEHLDRCRVNNYFRALIERANIGHSDFDEYLRRSESVELFCIFFDDDDKLLECKRRLSECGRLSFAQSAPHNLEIYYSDGGKGNTLLALADELGLSPDEVIAVGDSTNDLSLLGVAGLSLAMKNACPELKETADRVICHYSEHSAKYILDNIILG